MLDRRGGIVMLVILGLFQGCTGQQVAEDVDTSPLFSNEAWVKYKTSKGISDQRSRMFFLAEQLTTALHSSGRNHLTGDQLYEHEFQALKEMVSIFKPQLNLTNDEFLEVTIFIEKQPAGYYNIEVKSHETIFRSNTSVTWV